jgi:hypothetical protein
MVCPATVAASVRFGGELLEINGHSLASRSVSKLVSANLLASDGPFALAQRSRSPLVFWYLPLSIPEYEQHETEIVVALCVQRVMESAE